MYNISNPTQRQRLVMKSYIPEINSLIDPNRHYENIFNEKRVNKLQDLIEKHTHVIQSPNVPG